MSFGRGAVPKERKQAGERWVGEGREKEEGL